MPRAATRTVKRKPAARKTTVATRRIYRRRPTTVSGRGAYYVKGTVSGEGKIPYFGSAKFAAEGAYLRGLGSYNVSKIRRNVFLHGDPPSIRNSAALEGAVIVRHREYLGDIITSSTAGSFNIDSYSLNPAQITSFPWLHPIAAQFEEYMINGMVYEFKSTASDAIASSTNLALGNVVMATSYDPLNPPFASNMEMLNYEYAQSCKVSESAMHMIECDPRQSPLTHLYTRSGPAPGNADLRLYDFGTFYIATSGLQGTSVSIGQLWVSYEFAFFKPKLSSSILNGNMFKAYVPTPMGNNWFGSAAALALMVEDSHNDIPIQISAGSSNSGTITFPLLAAPVTFLVTVNYDVWTSSVVSWPAMTATNCVMIHGWGNNSSHADYSPADGATTTTGAISWYISTVANKVPSLTLSSGSIPSGGATGSIDIIVTRVAYLDPSNYGYST